MKLYVMRHGAAEPRAASDAERRLTAHGEAEVRAVATAAAARLTGLQGVFSSPYLRTCQTAAGLVRTLGFAGAPVIEPGLAPGSEVRGIGAVLASSGAEELLLVSHQPLVGDLLCWLCDDDSLEPLGTAHLVALELTAFTRGGAHLLWRERPPR